MGFISANVGRLMGSTSTALAGAQALLAGETQGLAFDFTDQSAYIIDTGTPANNYNSTGIVSNGSLVGPSGKLTYTSPSNKLTLQADGYYKYQAHNLCTYSEEIDNGAWGKNGTPTITANADGVAELWTPAASSTQHWIREPAYTAVAGVTYVFSVRVKPNGYTNLQLFTGSTEAGTTSYCNFVLSGAGSKGTEGATATGSISAVGDGYYDLQLQVTMTGGTATAYFYLCAISSSTAVRNETWTPDGASGYYVTRAHLYRYPANTDYIKTTTAAKYALPLEYSATDGSCLGLLVEEVRTNVCLYSNGMTTGGWTAEQLDSFAESSGDGIMSNLNQFLMIPNTTSTFHRVRHSTNTRTTFTGTTCYSVYAKPNGYTYLGIREDATTGSCCVFVLSGAGSAFTEHSSGAVTASGAKIESIGGGWYRCSVIMTATAASIRPAFYVVSSSYTSGDCVSATFAGDGSSGIYIALPQDEAGSFPTSPIVTYGAAATRAADNISISTSAFPHSTTATTMFVHAIPLVDNSSNVMLEKAAASRGDSLTQLYTNGSGSLTAADRGAAFASQASFDEVATIDGLTAHKIAISCQTNLFDASINGSTEAQDTSGTHQANAHTILYIGSGGTGAIKGNIIKQVKVLPRVSSAAEIQAETA